MGRRSRRPRSTILVVVTAVGLVVASCGVVEPDRGHRVVGATDDHRRPGRHRVDRRSHRRARSGTGQRGPRPQQARDRGGAGKPDPDRSVRVPPGRSQGRGAGRPRDRIRCRARLHAGRDDRGSPGVRRLGGVLGPHRWPGGGGEVHEQSGDRGWWFDFSAVQESGTYYLVDVVSDTRSPAFEVGDDVYDDVLDAALKMFWFNRANVEHPRSSQVPGRTRRPMSAVSRHPGPLGRRPG